jgi:hypothetical protein
VIVSLGTAAIGCPVERSETLKARRTFTISAPDTRVEQAFQACVKGPQKILGLQPLQHPRTDSAPSQTGQNPVTKVTFTLIR